MRDEVFTISYRLPMGAREEQREYVKGLLKFNMGKEIISRLPLDAPYVVEIWEEWLSPIPGDPYPTELLEMKLRISQVESRKVEMVLIEYTKIESWILGTKSKILRYFRREDKK